MRRQLLSLAAAFLLLGGCTTPAAIGTSVAPQSTPTGPWAGLGTGMVSAADPRAAAAGAEMLRQGGSAADAALATMVALTVVEPQSSGIGGGGFFVYADRGGPPVTYDGRETAPMAAGPGWFLKKDGEPMSFAEAQPGGKSVGVPGNIRLMALAHQRFGKLPWAKLFEPAIRLAHDGFAVTPRLRNMLERNKRIGALSAQARTLFYARDNRPKPVGAIIRNAPLAATLTQLANLGADSFYVGPNARALVATVNGAEQNPSKMSTGDLASYAARPRQPLCGEYRRHRICGMGPPSSGGTTVFAILKQLERFDVARLGPRSPTAWHLIAESMRLGFADRERYLADADFVPVPVAGLMDARYLAGRSALISPARTLASAPVGTPPGAPPTCPSIVIPESGTSHFVAVDRWGNVASQTSTIESAFGSGLMVNGYYLNNELTDFSSVPVKNGCAVANRVEGGKRPRSSMSPTIVYGPDGKVRLAVGAAGGATIIAQVARAIIAVVDWNMTAQQALALPVIFAPGDTVYLERGTYLEAMAPALRALGHAVEPRDPSFKANAIEWRDGRWVGAADPRSEGAAVPE